MFGFVYSQRGFRLEHKHTFNVGDNSNMVWSGEKCLNRYIFNQVNFTFLFDKERLKQLYLGLSPKLWMDQKSYGIFDHSLKHIIFLSLKSVG